MSTTYSPKIVQDSLRGYFDGKNARSYPGSGTAWSDLSGYNNGFTHTNVTFDSDGGFFIYDGSTSYSRGNPTTPNSFSANNTTASLGVWFRPHTVSPAAHMAVITDNYGPEFGIWVMTNGNIQGSAYGSIQTAATVNTWSYCVITSDSGVPNSSPADPYTAQLYKDGEYIGQATGGTGNGLNDWPLTLGYDAKGGDPDANFFDGDIAVVQMYQKVLTAVEVKQNFNALRGRFGI